RLDIARRVGGVAEGDPELPDRGVEAGVEVHDAAWPQSRDELLAQYQLARPLSQRFKHLERVVLQPQAHRAALELTRRRIEQPSIEANSRGAHAVQLPIRARSATSHKKIIRLSWSCARVVVSLPLEAGPWGTARDSRMADNFKEINDETRPARTRC